MKPATSHSPIRRHPGIAGRCFIGLIGFYRKFLSPLKPVCCRFEPTCSEYAAEAFATLGFWRALSLSIWRILRCHPFYHGNLIDPVPKK